MTPSPRADWPPSAADPSRLRRTARLARGLWFLEDELAVLPRVVPTGSTCLDVGANHGAYMVVLSWLAGRHGRVVAVEPQSGPLRVALALKRLLHLDNVELEQLALSDEEGALGLLVPHRWGLPVYGRAFLADAPAMGPRDLEDFTSARRRDVRATTLDALVAERDIDRLDFVKCDIEGAELRMLSGGAATIERHRPALLLEIEDRHVRKYDHAADDVVAWLHERDYKAHVLAGDALVHVGQVHDGIRNYFFLAR
jgi:FkbM family methyltransferase